MTPIDLIFFYVNIYTIDLLYWITTNDPRNSSTETLLQTTRSTKSLLRTLVIDTFVPSFVTCLSLQCEVGSVPTRLITVYCSPTVFHPTVTCVLTEKETWSLCTRVSSHRDLELTLKSQQELKRLVSFGDIGVTLNSNTNPTRPYPEQESGPLRYFNFGMNFPDCRLYTDECYVVLRLSYSISNFSSDRPYKRSIHNGSLIQETLC